MCRLMRIARTDGVQIIAPTDKVDRSEVQSMIN